MAGNILILSNINIKKQLSLQKAAFEYLKKQKLTF
tara:strand:- start:26221 stop:26325 length:105 start_codon:yes stop_codon:yes gene_type:complete